MRQPRKHSSVGKRVDTRSIGTRCRPRKRLLYTEGLVVSNFSFRLSQFQRCLVWWSEVTNVFPGVETTKYHHGRHRYVLQWLYSAITGWTNLLDLRADQPASQAQLQTARQRRRCEDGDVKMFGQTDTSHRYKLTKNIWTMQQEQQQVCHPKYLDRESSNSSDKNRVTWTREKTRRWKASRSYNEVFFMMVLVGFLAENCENNDDYI